MFSEDVNMVTLPALDGQMGVYPQHVPLMTQMVPGEIIVSQDGRETFLAVGEGLVEITGDRVRDRHRHGDSAEKHRRSQGRRGAPARRGPAARQDLRRRSRVGERVARPFAGAAEGQAAPIRRSS